MGRLALSWMGLPRCASLMDLVKFNPTHLRQFVQTWRHTVTRARDTGCQCMWEDVKWLRAAVWTAEEPPHNFLGPDKFLMYLTRVDALMSMVPSALAWRLFLGQELDLNLSLWHHADSRHTPNGDVLLGEWATVNLFDLSFSPNGIRLNRRRLRSSKTCSNWGEYYLLTPLCMKPPGHVHFKRRQHHQKALDSLIERHAFSSNVAFFFLLPSCQV